jgi:thiol-disulfide isomerase/thioredoxin
MNENMPTTSSITAVRRRRVPAFGAALLSLCLALLPLSSASALEIGQAAPEIGVTSADGKSITLSTLKGRTVYLDFWASWCGPCRQSFPFMNAMQEKYAKDGLVIVGINVDKKRADAEKFLAQFPARFAIAYDEAGATPATYGVRKMPSSVLIDKDGRVSSAHSGFNSEIGDEVESRIRAALAAR